MEMLGKTIVMHEGESCSFKFTLEQVNNGLVEPYLLPKLDNPYLLLSIASDTHDMHKRVADNFWLDLSKESSFNTTEWRLPEVSDLSGVVLDGPYEDTIGEYYYCNYISSSGQEIHLKCHRGECINKQNNTVIQSSFVQGSWIPAYTLLNEAVQRQYIIYASTMMGFFFAPYFSFDVTFDLQPLYTQRYNDGNYTYEVRLISAQETTKEVLTDMYKAVFGVNPDELTAPQYLYERIYEVRPGLLKGINYEAPICKYTTDWVIQKLERLIVKANNTPNARNYIMEANNGN